MSQTHPSAQLDETFHARARLGVMTLLAESEKEFVMLRNRLGLTDGNLGAHLRVLEEAGYVEIRKTFEKRKPKTTARITTKGRKAFLAYLAQLESIIKGARG